MMGEGDDGNVRSVDTGDPDKLQAGLDRMRRNYQALVEYGRLIASLRRDRYLQYLDQGFSEQQALELVKSDYAGGGS